jgi:hypothetical protein
VIEAANSNRRRNRKKERIMKPLKSVIAAMLLVLGAVSIAPAQTNVYVPGNASGCFGNPVDSYCVPFVPAITVSGPATITVTYVSGTVVFIGNGPQVGPTGGTCDPCQGQTPLAEAKSMGLVGGFNNTAALIGVFVPQTRTQKTGFTAIDGTKNLTKFGIQPAGLFYVGLTKTLSVTVPGTLYLGINDWLIYDNTGGFNVTVAAQ